MSKMIGLDSIRTTRFENPRGTIDDAALAELTKSIQAQGVLQPVVVVGPDSRTKQYDLVFGFRRLEASRKAGAKTIPAVVKKWNKEQVRIAQIVENVQREDLSEVDEAKAYGFMHSELGLSYTDIAAKIGKTKGYVSQRVSLLKKLAPEVVEALAQGDIPFVVARDELATLPKDQQVAVLSDAKEIQETAPQPPKKPRKPNGKPAKQTGGKRKKKSNQAKAVRQARASRSGQKPGTEESEESVEDRFAAMKAKLAAKFVKDTGKADQWADEHQAFFEDVLDFLFAKNLLIIR